MFESHVNYPQLTKNVSYDPIVMRSLPETNLTLRWVTNSYRYFNHCSDELYHQMSLRESLVLKAKDFINKCKMAFITDHPNVRKSQLSYHILNCDINLIKLTVGFDFTSIIVMPQ